MKKLATVCDQQFIEIEVNVTPEEEAELQSIAAGEKISVPELLRREALRDAAEYIAREQYVADVLKSLQCLRDTATGSGPLSHADVSEALLQLVNSLEQLMGGSNVEMKTPQSSH
jgi:hypothetical protein